MVQVVFHRLAAKEARAAEAWYAERSLRAAARFREAIAAAERLIAAEPEIHPLLAPGFRFVRVKRFPYQLVFHSVNASIVLVVAVAHARRKPGYWRRRT